MPLFEPLGPHKVAFFEVFFLALVPPGALLENLLYEDVVVSTAYVVLVCTKSLILRDLLLAHPVRLQYVVVKRSVHSLPDERQKILLFQESLHLVAELLGYRKLKVARAPVENLLLHCVELFESLEKQRVEDVHHLDGSVDGMLGEGFVLTVGELGL